MEKMILASSCLLGLCVNYRCHCHPHAELIRLASAGCVVCFCPEQGGGMPTPRIPSEIEHLKTSEQVLNKQAHVFNRDGQDVTSYFLHGAEQMVELARLVRPSLIVMRNGSPSCGVTQVYDGTFSGTKISGCGVTTCALKRLGYKVIGDNEFDTDISVK